MNKNSIYIGIAAIVGLLCGYLIFGTNDGAQKDRDVHIEGSNNSQKWTCSMHPQILQSEPGDCAICGMDLVSVQQNNDGVITNQFTMTENAMALANIETTIIGDKETGDHQITTLSGRVIENQEANAIQVSYFEGRIERLYVNSKGQQVKKGDRLATIYAPDLIAAQQELITAKALKETQPALYQAVRNKLKLWKLSEKQINAIEASKVPQEYFAIYATVAGTVSEMMSEEGDFVTKGQPILKVNNLSSLWVEFDAYENQIKQFKIGQPIQITSKAYPDKKLDAIISFIDPVLNTQTRTFIIRTVIDNRHHDYKPGMFLVGNINMGDHQGKQQLLVPESAVLWTGKRSIVYIRTDASTPVFEMREVTIGDRSDEKYTILEGLVKGDEIVTNGAFTVDAAAQLQGKKSMMNKRLEKEDSGDTKHSLKEKNTLSISLQKKVIDAFSIYIAMKNAFVASNPSKVASFATELLHHFKAIETSNMSVVEKQLVSKHITEIYTITKTDDIESQRTAFITLNDSMIALVSMLDQIITKIYVQRCPMANNNNGAVWLSTEKEIRNPYYGDAMLKCGSVIDTFIPKS